MIKKKNKQIKWKIVKGKLTRKQQKPRKENNKNKRKNDTH